MDFSSTSSFPAGGGLDSGKREQLMDQVKTQIAVANAQELLQVGPMFSLISNYRA